MGWRRPGWIQRLDDQSPPFHDVQQLPGAMLSRKACDGGPADLLMQSFVTPGSRHSPDVAAFMGSPGFEKTLKASGSPGCSGALRASRSTPTMSQPVRATRL